MELLHPFYYTFIADEIMTLYWEKKYGQQNYLKMLI